MRTAVGCLLVAAALAAAGCYSPPGYSGTTGPRHRVKGMKPLVAVTDFENRANFSGQWNLGSGMADLLVTELMNDGRVIVLERKDLGDVVGEIVRQGQDLFREEGRVARGRLKNAKFLFRGVVTDFTITGESSGWFSLSSLSLRGRRQMARVAINIKVSDVETGEIVTSVKSDSTVPAGGFGAAVDYKKIAFGGDSFFRTPLGRATEAAIRKAVRQILRELPSEKWEPMVAEAGPDSVVVNGGENVGLRGGEVFAVREKGRAVTDPATGNTLETLPGRQTGRIEVKTVQPLSAHAVIVEGEAHRGDLLERIPAP